MVCISKIGYLHVEYNVCNNLDWFIDWSIEMCLTWTVDVCMYSTSRHLADMGLLTSPHLTPTPTHLHTDPQAHPPCAASPAANLSAWRAPLVNAPTQMHVQSCTVEVQLYSRADSLTQASILPRSGKWVATFTKSLKMKCSRPCSALAGIKRVEGRQNCVIPLSTEHNLSAFAGSIQKKNLAIQVLWHLHFFYIYNRSR